MMLPLRLFADVVDMHGLVRQLAAATHARRYVALCVARGVSVTSECVRDFASAARLDAASAITGGAC